MSKKNKTARYSNELKLRAINLVLEDKLTIEVASAQTGASMSSIARRVDQYQAEKSGAKFTGLPITAEQARIRELERENKDLRLDVEILKKASAFFAKMLK